jgi:hypothetical protein
VKPHAVFVALLPIALGTGCFHQTGPEDASPVDMPALVSVRVEYRQPNGCLNVTSTCEGRVAFYGSWMPRGQAFLLTQISGTFVWRGIVPGVPVNFPPVDEPYKVWVSDPYLQDYQTAGQTADRLQVGGQILNQFYDYGTTAEAGAIYVDATGAGHSPF